MQTIDISIIIPTTGRKQEDLVRALDSVANQELGLFSAEIVLIPNGDLLDQTIAAAQAWVESHGDLDVRIFPTRTPGAGRARNIGLATARGRYITFLDDDDTLAPEFVSAGLEKSLGEDERTIVVLPLQELNDDGTPVAWSPLSQRLRMLSPRPSQAADSPWLLGFNASKIIPRDIATTFRFPEHLRSGEDVAYYLQFLAFEDLKVVRADAADRAAYRRFLGSDSVSRQAVSYDFNVTQRLECVASLQGTPIAALNEHVRSTQISAQYNFVLAYLEKHPEAAMDVAAELATYGLHDFPWTDAPKTAPETLFISYCFPPFADSAGYVAAKQIARGTELVDVISADMSSVRSIDTSSRQIAARRIREHSIIPGPPSFGFWLAIARFGRDSARKANRLNPAGYRHLRSRALWSGSHVAAALYKKRNPQTFWTAEFSDPMRFGVEGEERTGKLTPGRVTWTLKAMLRQYPSLAKMVSTHFDLVEFTTMVAADEIVFTNEHQRQVMLKDYPEDVRKEVLSKSTIAPQPQPLPEHIAAGSASDVFAEPGVAHIAYFGSFYAARGIGEILTAIGRSHNTVRENLRLHVFTARPGDVILQAREHGLEEVIEAHEALNYLDFLATAAQADVLLASDAETSEDFEVNPFLPSKVSDYLGVGVPIWGHVEPGSSLSELETKYKSSIHDDQSIQKVLGQLAGLANGV